MSEELLQRDLIKNPEKLGSWDFYNIGSTTIKDLKAYGIVRNVNYGDIEKKKVDGIIVQRKTVIAIIENKKPATFKTKQQQENAISQEIEVAKKLNCKLLIATDTKNTVWVNALTGNRIKDENGHEIKIVFDPKNDKTAALIEKITYSINELNDNLKPKQLVNPTGLAKQIWQDIWSVSGATPENCLYTFVELFIFKYLSDLGVLQGIYSFDQLIANFENNNPAEILETYARVIRPKIKELFPENAVDKTTIINGTIFVSKDQKAVNGYSTVFQKVLLKFKAYGKLEHIDYDFKSQLFESFLKESISKKNWGQFFTPLKVVRAIVEMAKDDIKDGVKICDPACGVGKFLLEPIITRLDSLYEISKKGIKPKITIHGFDKGFDKDEQKTIILAKANMLIYFSDLIKENPGLTKEFARLFNESFTLKTNSILGTLSEPVENEYDLILTNPPYVTSGSSNLKEEIKKDGELTNYYKINALGVEGLFMEWIIKALKPSGKAFIVIPDGTLNRQNDKTLRKFIADECFIDGIISLPLNTFFTTNKKTYILCLTKKADRKDFQKNPVFTYLVSEIGETRDVYRFDLDQNDLNEAVTLYSFFKGNKNAFAKINSDKRCKIIPYDFFNSNIEKNWVIDKAWTENEKVQLGIIEKNESVNLFEFSLIIEDVATTIKEFQDEIKEFAGKKKPELIFRQIRVTDLFDIKKGFSKYTKKYGDLNKGEYPVYSASNKEALAYIKTYDYDGEYLTWATNGFAGYIKIISGKFSINADRGLLEPKMKLINPRYIKHKLEPIIRGIAKGRKGERGEDEFTKVYPSMVENIEIPMPIDEHGNFDIAAQNNIVEEVALVEEINHKVVDFKRKIEELNVDIASQEITNKLSVGDVFDLTVKTNSSHFTKSFIEQHKGDVPVFSASKFPDSVDYGYVQDNLKGVKYFENCLTWNIDGSIGKAHYRHGRFALSEKVIPLIVRDNLKDKLDIDYLKYSTEIEFGKHAFGFGNKAGKGKIKNIKIPVPVDGKGELDVRQQKYLAEKYKRVEEIKSAIGRELSRVLDTHLVLR